MGVEYTPQPNVSAAAGRVNAPSIVLMVVAGLAVLGQLVSIVMNVVGASMPFAIPGASRDTDRIMNMMSGTLGVVVGLLMLVVYGIVIYGALKMRQLQNWTLALAASILAMLPCSCCCIFGLPAGIWAIVVLSNAEVKAAFR
jgi:hypothetical protein